MKKNLLILIFLFTSLSFLYSQPQYDTVYRLINTYRTDAVMAEDYGQHKVFCQSKGDNEDYEQLWIFRKYGDGWSIQNVYTGYYIQNETNNSNLFSTAETPAVLYVSKNNGFSIECYNIVNTNGATWGMHCDASYNVVPWHSAVNRFEGSEWIFEQVNVSDQELAAARAKFNEFNDVIVKKDTVMSVLAQYFEDETCTVLKSEYLSMSDEELAQSLQLCGNAVVEMALKIKNNSWAAREKEFRVHTYEPYSNPDHWSEIIKTSPYSWLNNPTGICASSGDVLYIFVGKEPSEGSTLEIDAITENNYKGIRIELKKGLNVIPIVRDEQTFFIIYTADTRKDYVLADFDSIPIHIEGGYVNGYWDKNRHNDDDWVDITRNHAKHKYMFVKGENELFFMNKEYMIADNCCPNTISDAIGWWDDLVKWEQEIMGIEDYKPSRFNNKLCAISTSSGYQAAGAYNTFHTQTYLYNLLPYKNVMNNSDNAWGPAHENGHIHQAAINMIRCGEVSNNLFSNIVTHKLGKFTTWGTNIDYMANDFENNVPWTTRDIGSMMRMYFQLYLYYHVAGNNPNFYPTLFKLLREDPMEKVSGDTDNYGRNDLLHFAEKCSEAAGEDLTDFFEAWGFFVPMSRITIGDYGSYTISSTKRMISDTKKELAKYSKRAGAIQFIEDRVVPVLRTDGGEGYKQGYIEGNCGDIGQYTSFVPDSMNVLANGYMYVKAGKNITISKGRGAVGFKVYSSDSTLLTFANTYKIELTDEMAIKDLLIVAVSANGTEISVKSKNSGTEEEQLESLHETLSLANTIIKFKDTGCKYVGYYYESVLLKLISLIDSANLAIENKDQSINTYGQWASLIDKEINNILSQENTKVTIQSGNSYKLTNVKYPGYSMYYDSGNIVCKNSNSSPKYMNFSFVSTGNEDEYYVKFNNKYIDYIGLSTQVTANSSSKDEAIKFTAKELESAKYYVCQTGSDRNSLHSDAAYNVVGWDFDADASLWYLVATNLSKENSDVKSLKTLIDEANSIYNSIVDTTKTDGFTFKDDIKILTENLSNDVDSMMNIVSESENVITKKYYNLCPELINRLTSVISLVKSGYTINTGIDDIYMEYKNSEIYDVRGRKIKNITKSGIYIIDNQKIYVK